MEDSIYHSGFCPFCWSDLLRSFRFRGEAGLGWSGSRRIGKKKIPGLTGQHRTSLVQSISVHRCLLMYLPLPYAYNSLVFSIVSLGTYLCTHKYFQLIYLLITKHKLFQIRKYLSIYSWYSISSIKYINI